MGLIFPLIINFNFNFSSNYKPIIENPKTSGPYYGIVIDDTIPVNGPNIGNWTWAITQPWCTKGNGTESDPYVIEDATFLPPLLGDCLTIQNSRKHFIIENCTFKDIPVASFAGLKLNNVTNGQVVDNLAYNNYLGIYLYESNDNIIMGNTATNNGDTGIYLYNCDDNTISANNASLNNYGITLNSYCSRNTLSENTANNNTGYGITLNYCYDNTISGNTANDNTHFGMYLIHSNYTNVMGNTANYNGDHGIWLSTDCNHNTISDNTANYNEDDGIRLDTNCDDNTISGNTASENTNYYGIELYLDCDNNTLSGNTVNKNLRGIYLAFNCDDNTISDNTANNNTYFGIYLYQSHYTNITDNTANYNDDHGIYLENNCDCNDIVDNIFYNNTQGIHIASGCDNNSIYKNLFLENGIHAIDDGTENYWNSTSIGNYWDNWTGPDSEPDGIVDTPYTYIKGSANSIDYFPIAEDGSPSIIINSPSEDDVFGTNTPDFSVTITDDFLDELWYTIDGGMHNFTFIGSTGTIEQLAWEALSDGTITLTFYASDLPGNIGSADINIVKDATGPTITINSPSAGSEFGTTAPDFVITVTDDHLDSMWYSLDGGLTNFTITTNAIIDQSAWAALSEGSITITFYANDTLGNLNSEEVTITKEIPPGGIDPTTIIFIVVVSVVGGVAIIVGVYIFMKKRATPE